MKKKITDYMDLNKSSGSDEFNSMDTQFDMSEEYNEPVEESSEEEISEEDNSENSEEESSEEESSEEESSEEDYKKSKPSIKLKDLDKHIIKSIRKKEKDLIIKNLSKSGLLKTCSSCGQFKQKFMYRTRKCKDCFKDYSRERYISRKKKIV